MVPYWYRTRIRYEARTLRLTEVSRCPTRVGHGHGQDTAWTRVGHHSGGVQFFKYFFAARTRLGWLDTARTPLTKKKSNFQFFKLNNKLNNN